MQEFFARLFSSEGFPPRWHCGDWSDFHGWLYVASDIGVWSAYTAIPAVLLYFVWRKVTIPFRRIFLLFGAFILFCGFTHLLDAVMFWWPAYRLLGLVEFFTAVVSWATVIALIPIVPQALSLRSSEELEKEVEARRRAEVELQQSNHDLERRIGERTAELQAADRRKDEFLATLAHELRNPLAPINNALELLKIETDPDATLWARQMMERQVKHVVRLVDDLLDVSRITQGKVRLQKEPVELSAAIQQAQDEIATELNARVNRLKVVLPREPIWIDADPVRLVQIFSNLLTNAIKYSDDPSEIELSAAMEGRRLIVRVHDSGIGLPPDMLEQIFVPFTQVAPTNDRARGGMGIGLSLVRRLVELHGGTVVAQSEGLGKGSTFVVSLPTIALPRKPLTTNPAPAQVARQRILVVDDNQEAAQTLAALLTKRWGHVVELAADGRAALAVFASFGPAIVVLDIGMPGLSGYETAERMRKLPGGDRVFLVALTGYGQDQDREQAIRCGFDLHLVKPAAPADLERMIEMAMRTDRP